MKNMLKKIPSWLKYTLPIFIIFTIVLLVYYPGILESDSMVQWDQVQRAVFTNWHPAYNTIYIYLLTRIWNNPFFVLLVQCFILSFSFGMCLTKIKKYYNIKKKYLYIFAILFAIIPLNFNFAVTLLKDILYSAFILLLTGEFISVANEKEKSFSDKDLAELEKYVNIEQLKESFNQYNMDYSINSQNIEYIKEHNKEYLKFALKKILENPLTFIEYYLKLDSYLYSPISFKGSYTAGMFIETDLWLYKDTYPDLKENSKIPFLLKPLKFVSKAYQYDFIGVITMRPAIYMYSSIIMLYFISKWQKNKKKWLIIFPAIFNIISLALAIPVGMTRYIFSMILVFYVILIIFLTLFIPKIKEKSK